MNFGDSKGLDENDVTVVTRGVSEKNTADYSAIVTSIRYHGADLVMFAGYYADAANCIRQLRLSNVNVLGCVMNGTKTGKGYYSKYRYKRYSKYYKHYGNYESTDKTSGGQTDD